MRRLAVLVVLVSVCVVSLIPCPLLAAPNTDISAEHSVTRVATADMTRSHRTYEILWDLSHGPYGSYTPSGQFSNMADTLAYNAEKILRDARFDNDAFLSVSINSQGEPLITDMIIRGESLNELIKQLPEE